eukprot:s392_g28.t1
MCGWEDRELLLLLAGRSEEIAPPEPVASERRRAHAQLISEEVRPEAMPSLQDLRKAHRRQKKRTNGEAFGVDCAADWLTFLQAMKERPAIRTCQFEYVPLQCKLSWLPVAMLAAEQPQPAEGSTMMVSANMVEMARRMLPGGLRGSRRLTLCVDATYKISCSGLVTLILWTFASEIHL